MTNTLFEAVAFRVFRVLPRRGGVPVPLHFHALFAASLYALFIGKEPSVLRADKDKLGELFQECRAQHPVLSEPGTIEAYTRIVKHARDHNAELSRLVDATDDEVFEDYMRLVFMATHAITVDGVLREKVEHLLTIAEIMDLQQTACGEEDTDAPPFVKELLASHAPECRQDIDLFIDFHRTAGSHFETVCLFQAYMDTILEGQSSEECTHLSAEAFVHFNIASQIHAFFLGAEYALSEHVEGAVQDTSPAPAVRLHGSAKQVN
jgi:hypothetical protein